MKNFIKIFILVVGFTSLQSCEDDLDQLPNDSLSPDSYYKTIGDFETAMRGVYSGFLNGAYYGGSFTSRPDIQTDNVIIAPAGRRSNQAFHEWRYNPNVAWDLMSSAYVVVNRANLIIDNIDNIQGVPGALNILAQARTARALAHFDLVRLYSQIPTQSAGASASLGMPVIVELDPNIRKLRPTVEETYDFIISELETSRTLISADNGVGAFNRDGVNALLSRVYLYNGDYQDAINAANRVNTPVSEISNFAQIWVDGSEDGVIMKIDQDRVLDGVNIGVEWSQSNAGAIVPEYVMEFDLFNMYESDDVRKAAYTQILPDSEGNLYNAITKMFGEAGQNNGIVDPKLIRAAEVYLNKAEAHAMLNQDGPALDALDMVRANRYSTFSSGNETGAALLDAIKKERRLEFFAESHRLFDIKRWGESINRNPSNGEFFDGTGTPYPPGFTDLNAGDHLFQMPIPQGEINVYPEFQQNPEY
ncbi:RagB/SusD family nutrient uptake outer membrane protein [Urechidicola sp. KH5]